MSRPTLTTLAWTLLLTGLTAQSVLAQATFLRRDDLGLGDDYLSTGLYGPGVSAVDYDGDLDLDLFVCNEPHGNRVWTSQPEGIVDLGPALGLNAIATLPPIEDRQNPGDPEVSSMMPAWIDFENDGDKDLYLTGWNTYNRLYRNEGDGTFTDLTATSPTNLVGRSATVSFADYNRDGFLDFYFVDWGELDRFFKSIDGTQFTDESQQAGFWSAVNPQRPGFCAIWFYQNGDRRPDLYVGNDWGIPNYLFQNQGTTFFDHARDCFPEMDQPGTGNATMGQTLGDFDRDGDYDLFVANTLDNNFYRRDGNIYTDLFKSADLTVRGLKDTDIGWFCDFTDIDNDGWLDLFLVNGFIPLCPREDPGYPLDCGGGGKLEQPNRLWMNQGGTSFLDATDTAGIASLGWGRAGVVADFDMDGDVDIFVTNNDGDHEYYQNETPDQGNWLTIRLESTVNRDAIGTQLEIEADGAVHRRDLFASTGYLSQPPDEIYVGLGDATVVDRLTIRWPRGPSANEEFNNIPVNQRIQIRQGASAVGSTLPVAPMVTATATHEAVELSLDTELAWDELLVFRVAGDWAARVPVTTTSVEGVTVLVDDGVAPGEEYTYHVAGRQGPFLVTAAAVTVQVAEPPTSPLSTPLLHPNVPNPFNPGTVLSFDVPGDQPLACKLRIYDAAGRLIRTLVDEPRQGSQQETWDGTNDAGRAVRSGVYFARYEVAGHAPQARKLTLIR